MLKAAMQVAVAAAGCVNYYVLFCLFIFAIKFDPNAGFRSRRSACMLLI
jgi:hypothetical protein